MIKSFYVFRAGPMKREVLKVSLNNLALRITGNPNLVRSLEEEGVTDLQTGRRYSVTNRQPQNERELVFEALKARFQRDSVYVVQDSP